MTKSVQEEMLGKRITIIGNHPHEGERGVTESWERTLVGYGLKVKLDNGEGCFVFDNCNIKWD